MRKFSPKKYYVSRNNEYFPFEKKMDAVHFFHKIDLPNAKVDWLGFWDGDKFVDKKSPSLIIGNYYFEIQTEEYPILISRHSKKEADYTFSMYENMCSKSCQWLGVWNGHTFVLAQTASI